MAIYSYRAFGTVIQSELPLPELPEAVTPPRGALPRPLSFSISETSPTSLAEPMGSDSVFQGITVSSARHSDGLSLIYSDTGRFDIRAAGTEIVWFRPAGSGEELLEAVRADLIGRVSALALHLQGLECLHASAVSVSGKGIAFVAPKGWGKSTLAAALCTEGALLLSDDTLPLTIGDDISVLPGVPHVRLRPDSAERLFDSPAAQAGGERKVVLNDLPDQAEAIQLDTIYLLSPVTPDTTAVTRERVPDVIATLALVEHSKLGALLTGNEAAAAFSRLADVARQVPVYHLMIPRDLSVLAGAARTLLTWHAGGH